MELLGDVLNIIVVVLLLSVPVFVGAMMVRRGGRIAKPIGIVLAVGFGVLIVIVIFSYVMTDEATQEVETRQASIR